MSEHFFFYWILNTNLTSIKFAWKSNTSIFIKKTIKRISDGEGEDFFILEIF